jgi:hypothetical protein
MTVSLTYPLEQIIKVKEKRVLDQEKVVQAKEQALQKEKDKLLERERDRDAAKQHEQDKLLQLRAELDSNTTTGKVQQMKSYLNVAKEKTKVEEKKVKDQQAQVEQAKNALDLAIEDLRLKRQQVDKMYDHKKSWKKEMQKELEVIEAREQDELGTTMFLNHQRLYKKYTTK